MMSLHGVKKPVYHALQLVKRLLPYRLPLIDAAAVSRKGTTEASTGPTDIVVTREIRNGQSRSAKVVIEALVTHHPTARLDAQRAANAAQVMGHERAASTPVKVKITFHGAPPPKGHAVTLQRVDTRHSNALPAFHAAGAPKYPNSTMLNILKAASVMDKESLEVIHEEGGAWSVELIMPEFSVASVSFTAELH